MKPDIQKNMYEVRKLRDEIDATIKTVFHSGQSVKEAKKRLLELLNEDRDVVVYSQEE